MKKLIIVALIMLTSSLSYAELNQEFLMNVDALKAKFSAAFEEERVLQGIQNRQETLTQADKELVLQKKCNRIKTEMAMYDYVRNNAQQASILLGDESITKEYLEQKYNTELQRYLALKKELENTQYPCG